MRINSPVAPSPRRHRGLIEAMPATTIDMAHNIYNIGDGRDFIVFNDQALKFEPITAEDIIRIELADGNGPASMAWSSGCNYYFIVQDEGIALLNVYTKRGLLCRKKSARFIEMFLETQPPKKARRRKVA